MALGAPCVVSCPQVLLTFMEQNALKSQRHLLVVIENNWCSRASIEKDNEAATTMPWLTIFRHNLEVRTLTLKIWPFALVKYLEHAFSIAIFINSVSRITEFFLQNLDDIHDFFPVYYWPSHFKTHAYTRATHSCLSSFRDDPCINLISTFFR